MKIDDFEDQAYLEQAMILEKEKHELINTELQEYFEQAMQKEQDEQALFEQDMFEYMDTVFYEGLEKELEHLQSETQ